MYQCGGCGASLRGNLSSVPCSAPQRFFFPFGLVSPYLTDSPVRAQQRTAPAPAQETPTCLRLLRAATWTPATSRRPAGPAPRLLPMSGALAGPAPRPLRMAGALLTPPRLAMPSPPTPCRRGIVFLTKWRWSRRGGANRLRPLRRSMAAAQQEMPVETETPPLNRWMIQTRGRNARSNRPMLRERGTQVKLQRSRSTASTRTVISNLRRNHQLLNLHGDKKKRKMQGKRRRAHLVALSSKNNIWGPCGRRFSRRWMSSKATSPNFSASPQSSTRHARAHLVFPSKKATCPARRRRPRSSLPERVTPPLLPTATVAAQLVR